MATRLEPDGAGLVALTVQHPDGAPPGVDVLRIERQGFTDPQAAPVERDEKSATRRARLRTPVGARVEEAQMRALTSSAVRTSAGNVRPLLDPGDKFLG